MNVIQDFKLYLRSTKAIERRTALLPYACKPQTWSGPRTYADRIRPQECSPFFVCRRHQQEAHVNDGGCGLA